MSAPASSPSSPRSGFAWSWLVAGVIAVGLLVTFPPFHVVSKRAVAQTVATAAAGDFAPAAFAEKFWSEQLQPAASAAPAIGPLLTDLRRDPAAAIRNHGHLVGLGNAVYFFARGSGRITAVERSRLLVEIDGVTVAVRTGPVFGNVVRDGCGLLEVNQVPGLAEFNALSAEINRLVEERVQPVMKPAGTVGAMISFAGCAEAPEALPKDSPLLTFIPVQVEIMH